MQRVMLMKVMLVHVLVLAGNVAGNCARIQVETMTH